MNILKNLRKTIELAYQTKFYGSIMRERGIKPEDINDISDLKKFPVVSKDEIIKDYWTLSINLNNYGHCSTRR